MDAEIKNYYTITENLVDFPGQDIGDYLFDNSIMYSLVASSKNSGKPAKILYTAELTGQEAVFLALLHPNATVEKFNKSSPIPFLNL